MPAIRRALVSRIARTGIEAERMGSSTLTAKERAMIRNEFMSRFGPPPKLADGILVKRWVTGPNKGKPKPSLTTQGLLDRGLMELPDDGGHWLRARFTAAGIAALREMAEDRRALPPTEYQHVLDELGIRQAGDRDDASSPML